jgi:hypothetical protein
MYNICHDYYLYLSKKFVDMLIGVSSSVVVCSSVSGVSIILSTTLFITFDLIHALVRTAVIAACQSFGFCATALAIYGSSLLNALISVQESNQYN